MAEQKSFAQLYEEYQKTPTDDLFKQIENYLKKKKKPELQEIKDSIELFTLQKDKYKTGKGEYKTTFSSLNKTERIEQILENIKVKPQAGPSVVSPPEGGEEVEEAITEGLKGKKPKKKTKEEKEQSLELELEGEGEDITVEVPVQGGQTSSVGGILDDPTAMKKLFRQQNVLISQGQLGEAYKKLTDTLKGTTKDIEAVQAVKKQIDDLSKSKILSGSTKYLFDTYSKNLEKTIENKKFLTKEEFITVDKEILKSLKTKEGEKEGEKEEKPKEGEKEEKPKEGEKDAIDKAIDKLFADKPPVPPEPPTGGGDKPPEPPTGGDKPPVKPPPTPVDPLPPIIQPSKIKVEDIQTDLDRYREATKKLRNLIKGMNAEGTQQKIPDFEYDTVRYRLLNGKPMSPDEQQHMNEIRDIKKQIEETEEGAKKIAKEILEKERRSVTATQRTGLLGPHLANDTTKAVKEQLDKTPEQQIKDISNWYIFDVPSDSTGQGTKIDNPLVAQNEMREKMLLDGATLFTSLSNYTLQEGPFERQDFFHQHPELTRAGIGRGIFEVETEQTKEQFLEKFNDGNNGLFSQDQTREEVSDFQNIYQKPARMIGGADYNFDFTNNRGIKHTDKVWLSNLNLFFDNAPIL